MVVETWYSITFLLNSKASYMEIDGLYEEEAKIDGIGGILKTKTADEA